jgi:uncharacterized protein (TIGR00255 family)
MTGFGKATASTGSAMITVEVKSLNSKFLELNLRLPAAYKDKDLDLRNEISRQVERGKVDFFVSVEPGAGNGKNAINKDAVRQYLNDFREIQRELKITSGDYLNIIMRLPNVLNTEKTEADPSEWKKVEALCKKALKAFTEFRETEGKVLLRDFEQRIKSIESSLKKIDKLDPERIKSIRTRIGKGFEEWDDQGTVDKNRFEQELIYYIEKIDITEEKVRLKSHLEYFMKTLHEKESNGKKLGFILQEIGREINTIGAKANDAGVQRLVVEMKDELEKMKEQTANVV